MTDDDNVRRTAAHLRVLLQERPEYFRRWRASAHRVTSLNQAAIAEVLAAHLWESGEADERDRSVPRRLKDTVSRALSGRHVSARTLTWFIDAFEMSSEDSADLWALRVGGAPRGGIAVVQGCAEPPSHASPPRHRTLSVHEVHVLGPDGLPAEHRTTQVLQAVAEMDSYLFRFDTDVAVVQVLRGGRAGPVRHADLPGLFAVDIRLSSPLAPGATTALEYRTLFAYRSPPPAEFRRAAYRRVDNVELAVRFHPDRLPVAVRWCEWNRHDEDDPYAVEDVQLDADHTVHRYLARLENAAVGFRWTFA